MNLSQHSMAVMRLCLSTLKPNKTYLPTLVTNTRVFVHQSPLLFIYPKPLSTKARTKDTTNVQDNSSDVERNQIQRIPKGPDEKTVPASFGPDGPNLGQLSEPPVLFIGKYQRAIDTRELELRDELSDIAKKGKMTPESLTQQKVCCNQLHVHFLNAFIGAIHIGGSAPDVDNRDIGRPASKRAGASASTTHRHSNRALGLRRLRF